MIKNLIQIAFTSVIKSNMVINVKIFKLFFVMFVDKRMFIICVILNLNDKFFLKNNIFKK